MNKKYVLGLIGNAIFTVLGVAVIVTCILTRKTFAIVDIVNLLVYIGVLYYSIKGYKKPHGNLLKYLMLIFAAGLIFSIYTNVETKDYISVICLAIVMIGFAFCSGRLHKIKQNQIIMIVLLAVLAFALIFAVAKESTNKPMNQDDSANPPSEVTEGSPAPSGEVTPPGGEGTTVPSGDVTPPSGTDAPEEEGMPFLEVIYLIAKFSSLILALDIVGAYFARYAEHKEAGVMDDNEYERQQLNDTSLNDVSGGANSANPLGGPQPDDDKESDDGEKRKIFF